MDWQELASNVVKWSTTYIKQTVGNLVAAQFSIGRDFVLQDKDIRFAQSSAILDRRTCEWCKFLDGKIFDVNDEEFTSGKYGVPRHKSCRCLWIYITKWEPDVKANWVPMSDEEIEEYMPKMGSYERWKIKGSVFPRLIDLVSGMFNFSENTAMKFAWIPSDTIKWITYGGKRIPIKVKKVMGGKILRFLKKSEQSKIHNLFKTKRSGIEPTEYGANRPEIISFLNKKQKVLMKSLSSESNEVLAYDIAHDIGLRKNIPVIINRKGVYISKYINAPNAFEYFKKRVKAGAKIEDVQEELLGIVKSKSGRKVGIFDYITGQGDRNEGNWLIKKGEPIIIDNDALRPAAAEYIYSPFVQNILNNPLTDREIKYVQAVKRKIIRKKHLFPDEYVFDNALERADHLIKRRLPDSNLIEAGDLPFPYDIENYTNYLSEDTDSFEKEILYFSAINRNIIKWITVHGKRIPIRMKRGVLGASKLNRFRLQNESNALRNIMKNKMVVRREQLSDIADEGVNAAQRLLMSNGDHLIYKNTYDRFVGSDNEVLAYGLAKMFGLGSNVPVTIKQYGGFFDRPNIIQKYIPANSVKQMYYTTLNNRRKRTALREYFTNIVKSEEGRKIGLFDYIIKNPDRHPGNWMIDKTGKVILIDHEAAFGNPIGYSQVRSPFAEAMIGYRLNNREVNYLKYLQRKIARSERLFPDKKKYNLVQKRIDKLISDRTVDEDEIYKQTWDMEEDMIAL